MQMPTSQPRRIYQNSGQVSRKWTTVGEDERYGGNHERRNAKETIHRCRKIHLFGCESREITIGNFTLRQSILETLSVYRKSPSAKLGMSRIESPINARCCISWQERSVFAQIKNRGIPSLQKVLLDVGEWRKEEISQEHRPTEHCEEKTDQVIADLRSLSHDALNNGHDRDYRGISVFPHELLIASEVNVRVFDLRVRAER